MIEAGKPLVVRLGFSLRPNLTRARRIAGARLDKIQTTTAQATAPRRRLVRMIRNHELQFFVGLVRAISDEGEGTAIKSVTELVEYTVNVK